jgi:hypothetical protein
MLTKTSLEFMQNDIVNIDFMICGNASLKDFDALETILDCLLQSSHYGLWGHDGMTDMILAFFDESGATLY